jgi:hypothetical protein
MWRVSRPCLRDRLDRGDLFAAPLGISRAWHPMPVANAPALRARAALLSQAAQVTVGGRRCDALDDGDWLPQLVLLSRWLHSRW